MSLMMILNVPSTVFFVPSILGMHVRAAEVNTVVEDSSKTRKHMHTLQKPPPPPQPYVVATVVVVVVMVFDVGWYGGSSLMNGGSTSPQCFHCHTSEKQYLYVAVFDFASVSDDDVVVVVVNVFVPSCFF